MSEKPMSDYEAMCTAINVAMRPYLKAARPTLVRIANELCAAVEAMRPLVDYYEQHPEELEALRHQEPGESCHCLCGLHRDRPDIECEGEAVPGLTITRHPQTVGTVHIPMCRPCHDVAADCPIRVPS